MSTRAHIFKACENFECLSKSNKDHEKVNLWGDALHDVIVVEGRQVTCCSICGQRQYFSDPDNKTKMRWPMFNASIGKTFNSRAEETAFAKKNKLVPQN